MGVQGGPVSLIFAFLAFGLLILNRIAPQTFWKYRSSSITAYKLGKAIGIGIIGNVVCKQENLRQGSEIFAALHSVLIGGKVLFLLMHLGGGHVSFLIEPPTWT